MSLCRIKLRYKPAWRCKTRVKATSAIAGFHADTLFRLNWNLEMLVFVEGGKQENPEKNRWNKDDNQQQTQLTYDWSGSGNRTHSKLVGGKYSHHWAILTPLQNYIITSRPACDFI